MYNTASPAEPQLQRGAHRQHRLLGRDRALRVLRRRSAPTPSARATSRSAATRTTPTTPGLIRQGDDDFCLPSGVDAGVDQRVSGHRRRLRRRRLQAHLARVDLQPDRRPAAQPAADPVHEPAHARPQLQRMAFESNISRDESDDTSFRWTTRASGTSTTRRIRTRARDASTRRPTRSSIRSTARPRALGPAGGSRVASTSRAPPTSSAAARAPSTARCAASSTRRRRSAR